MRFCSLVRAGSSRLSSQPTVSVENLNKNEKLSTEESASADHRVNFDPDGFSCAVQNILGTKIFFYFTPLLLNFFVTLLMNC